MNPFSQSKLNANSRHSQYEEFWAEHFTISCGLFITHLLRQGLKCNLSVVACVAGKKHTVWLVHWCFLPVYSSSPWDIFFITTTGLHSAHSPSKRSSVLPVRQLRACFRDWPELPAALWLWCRCWTPAWEDRPAPDWSHRSLTEKTKRQEEVFDINCTAADHSQYYFLYFYCDTTSQNRQKKNSYDLTSRHLIKLLSQWFCKLVVMTLFWAADWILNVCFIFPTGSNTTDNSLFLIYFRLKPHLSETGRKWNRH